MKNIHTNFRMKSSGFFICRQESLSFLGASPDSMVDCLCCGRGVVEIKCPFCKRDSSVEEAAEDKRFCLSSVDGKLSLKKDHIYYYQTQLQMFVTGTDYCHFVVWTQKHEPHIETICFDQEFMANVLPKAT